MTTTASIHSQKTSNDGSSRVVYEFTRVESGATWRSGTHYLEPGVDAQTIGDSLTERQEDAKIEEEKQLWVREFFNGTDIDTLSNDFAALPILRKRCLRSLVNAMRVGYDKQQPDEPDKAIVAANTLPWVLSKTNTFLSNLLDAALWTDQQVGQFKTRLQTLADGAADVDLGHGELNPDG